MKKIAKGICAVALAVTVLAPVATSSASSDGPSYLKCHVLSPRCGIG